MTYPIVQRSWQALFFLYRIYIYSLRDTKSASCTKSASWSRTSVHARCSKLVKSTSARQKSNMWIISCARTLQHMGRQCELFSQTTICHHKQLCICHHHNWMLFTATYDRRFSSCNNWLTVHFSQSLAHSQLLLLLPADHTSCCCRHTVITRVM